MLDKTCKYFPFESHYNMGTEDMLVPSHKLVVLVAACSFILCLVFHWIILRWMLNLLCMPVIILSKKKK